VAANPAEQLLPPPVSYCRTHAGSRSGGGFCSAKPPPAFRWMCNDVIGTELGPSTQRHVRSDLIPIPPGYGNPLLELLKPIEHNMNLLGPGCSRFVVEDADQRLAVSRHVV